MLPGERDELIEIFTKYTSSDIDGLTTMLDVLDLFIASRNAPIKEVRFPAILEPSFVTASPAAIEGAVNKFLGIEASGGPRGALELPSNTGNTGIVPEQRKRARRGQQANQNEPKAPPTPSLGNDGLVDAGQFSRDLAGKVANKTLRSFPVFYPRRLPSGTIYRPGSARLQAARHRQELARRVQDGDAAPAGRLLRPAGDPRLDRPADPRQTRARPGRSPAASTASISRVIGCGWSSWEQGDNVYWVSNSLLQTLTNDQMLGIARSIGKVPGERVPRRGGRNR